MDHLWRQVRVAARSLMRAPVLSGAAIACLGLGIGATVAIYSAVHTVLLEPLPFFEPDRLVSVFRTTPQFRSGPFSPGVFHDLTSQGDSFQGLAALTSGVALLQGVDEPMRASVNRASGNLFDVLGIPATQGRLLQATDDEAGGPMVAVVSAELARDRFGGLDVVGRSISLDGEVHEIVGVLPTLFELPHGGQVFSADIWVPLRFTAAQASTRRSNYLSVVGRLADGVSIEAADAGLRAAMDGIAEAYPSLRGEQLRVVSLQHESVQAVRQPLLLLLGSVGFVLLIAVANVASLLLARGVGRREELAVRAVLGAGQVQLVRPVLVECALLTSVGAGIGFLLAWGGVRVMRTLLPSSLPQLADLEISVPVMGFAVAVSAVVAAVCALAPVWQARHGDPQDALRSGGRGGTGGRQHLWLRGLVVAEVTLSIVLLLGGGLVIRGFGELVGQDPGFDPEPLLKLAVNVDPARYAETTVADGFLTPALDRVRGIPGVLEVGSLNLIPYQNWGNNFNIRYEGQDAIDPTQRPLVERRVIAPGGFAALGLSLVKGRFLSVDDRAEDDMVVVVNEALAARDFPGEEVLGKRFHSSDTTFVTIVGVVRNIKNVGPVRAPSPEAYFSHFQGSSGSSYIPLLVRVAGDPAGFARSVTDAIREVDPTAAVSSVAPMTEVMSRSVARARFYMVLLAVFAAVALLLAVAGLYGVMNYAVARRTREIGIRSALGSSPRATIGFVLRQGLGLVGFGLGLGLLLTYPLTSFLGSFLYGVSQLDLVTWTLVPLTLGVVALLAVLIPARRAASIDPLIAMRAD